MSRTPAPTHHLNAGEVIICTEAAVVATVLGSCVSICLHSPSKKMGGMIHYVHPRIVSRHGQDADFRYGEIAIPALIEEFSRVTGEPPHRFVAKIVGGASESHRGFDIGIENIQIARDLLAKHQIRVLGEDVGGSQGRQVFFHTASHRLQVAMIPSTIFSEEKKAAPPPTPEPSTARRRVLIVDGSKPVRDLLARLIGEDPDLEIVGTAANVIEANHLLTSAKPDIMMLDAQLPGSSAVKWLERLLPVRPIPVLMISSLRPQEGNDIFRALELGAVDCVQKPSFADVNVIGPILREKVKSASFAKVAKRRSSAKRRTANPVHMDMRKILAIGSSTGGTEALRVVLQALPERIPPTVVVQHIPPGFSKALAIRLNELCPFEVKEAENGDEVRAGRVLIAPGGKQMKLQRTAAGLVVRLNDDAPVNRHKPSVDYLFNSVAAHVGKNSVGVILTGMGNDGAQGLLTMKKKGSRTIAQNEETSVVYGMPKVAADIGAVDKVAALDDIANEIVLALSARSAA